MPVPKTQNELRCICSRNPLLATYGLDGQGELYVHIKVFKQGRIFGELLVKRGEVKIRCRDCLRWHRVVMRQPEKNVILEPVPDAMAPEV